MKKKLIMFLLLIVNVNISYAEKTTIRVWSHTVNNAGMTASLLHRALQITQQEYGEYEFVLSHKMKQDRALRELVSGRIDIAHFVSTSEREKQATPIRIPIMQGLLGYRLCLIKEDNQKKFIGVNNIKQWIDKNITIAQDKRWPDTKILESNGVNVQTTFKHELLFQQLSKARFDCFARGISEISLEQQEHSSLGLIIEKHIVIHYPLPQFFFVAADKPLLAERLKLGLTRLQENGEAELLFDSYYQAILDNLELKKRVFIELQNSTLSPETIDVINSPVIQSLPKYLQKKTR